MLSALSPAREAAQVSPVEAMARGQREYAARVHKCARPVDCRRSGMRRHAASQRSSHRRQTAVRLSVGDPLYRRFGVGHSRHCRPDPGGLLRGALRSLLGVEALLASRSLVASLRRTSVLVGALSTAIAMMTSVGIMVGSFRQTVSRLDGRSTSGRSLSAPGRRSGARPPSHHLDPISPIASQKLPGVEGVDRFRAYDISYQGMPATLGFR